MVLHTTTSRLHHHLAFSRAGSGSHAFWSRLCRHGRSWFSSSASSQRHASQSASRIRSSVKFTTATVLLFGTGTSLYVRHWRQVKLEQLLEDHKFEGPSSSSSSACPRSAEELFVVVERSGLMGKHGAKSVKDELEDIRRWHVNRGYKGGLVLRELLQPLFGNKDQNGNESIIEDLTGLNLPRRECYYLYYEITPTGEIKHEIFCRGTNLTIDIWTSLMTWMVYDEDLGCRVHMGFNRQANHILADILPLLAPPSARTTVRVSGHSLGGAVAYLLAAKLRQRGYRVVQVTGVEAPRVCATQTGAKILMGLLPDDTMRIENDTDPVPLLPPFGHSVGNKLYLVDDKGAVAYLPAKAAGKGAGRLGDGGDYEEGNWTDSVFINARVWEILKAGGRTHRVPYVLAQMKAAIGTGRAKNEDITAKQKVPSLPGKME